MEVFRTEIKVGLLIAVSFVLLTVGIFVVSDLRDLWDEKKTVTVHFPYADGVTRGSPVWYAGFEVGEVSDIRIARDDRIAITVRVSPEARIRRDSRIDIRNLGMMGAKYIEISPGSPDAPEVAPGETLEGQNPASLSAIIETGQQVAGRIALLVDETHALIREFRTESSVKETIQNANGLLVEMRAQTQNLTPVIQKLDTFSDSLNETGRNLKAASGEGGKELTALLKELRDTNRSLQKRMESVEGQLTRTLTQVDKGVNEAEGAVKGVRSVLASSEDDIASLLQHLTETARHLEALSEDLRAHPWKVVWKKDGTQDVLNPVGSDQWREKGRIGPHGKE